VPFPSQRRDQSVDQPRSAAAPARSEARTAAAPQRGALGLVHSSTSDKPIRVDPLEARLSRMRRGCITAARLHQEGLTKGGFRWRAAFLTLTYRDVEGWCARHISDLLKHVREWLRRRGYSLCHAWVAELQERGAMHYHVVLWLPKGLTLPKPDKQGWWPHGMTKIEWARNPVGYMAKYVSKGDGLTKFPKGARIHGCGGLRGIQLQEARYWRRPTWLREVTVIQDQVRRRVGGGWFDVETGEIFESPWRVFFEGGGVWICRIDQDAASGISHANQDRRNDVSSLVS